MVPALDGLGGAGRGSGVDGGRAYELAQTFLLEDVGTPARGAAAGDIAGIMSVGTSAKSRMTAAQNSTFVLMARSGRRSRSSARAACSSEQQPRSGAQAFGGRAQHPRARTFGAVDAVPEAHQLFLAVEDALDQCAGVVTLFGVLESWCMKAPRRATA